MLYATFKLKRNPQLESFSNVAKKLRLVTRNTYITLIDSIGHYNLPQSFHPKFKFFMILTFMI